MGGLIAWLGWRDDVQSLSPKLRLLVQTLAAVVTIFGLGYFRSLTIPLLGEINVGWFGIPLTVLWIVGLTNAYNFMDGLDGFAGGVAVAAGFSWMLLSYFSGKFQNELVFWISFSITAGSAGFLIHNWPPAKIFMGDVASTFLGYSFAVVPLISMRNTSGDAAMAAVVIMWTFILDGGITFARRLIKGEHVFEAHRTHLYQRLAINGVRNFQVNLLFIALTFTGLLLLLGWLRGVQWIPAVILFGLPGLWILLSWITKRMEND
jgi:UDP-N-acetylmuramyl pentapeptide phosphotransferase/UDP-N-acetylglucosamine-1-phosphate transferase